MRSWTSVRKQPGKSLSSGCALPVPSFFRLAKAVWGIQKRTVLWNDTSGLHNLWVPSRSRVLPSRSHSGLNATVQSQAKASAASAETVLARLRSGMGTSKMPMQSEVVVTGTGRHLGINMTWSMRWTADGAFQEEITGKELGFQWGYDGSEGGLVWEKDSSGVAKDLECDDHEALLIGAWVRTGVWLQPELTRRLEVTVLSQPSKSSMMAALQSAVRAVEAKVGSSGSSSEDEADMRPSKSTRTKVDRSDVYGTPATGSRAQPANQAQPSTSSSSYSAATGSSNSSAGSSKRPVIGRKAVRAAEASRAMGLTSTDGTNEQPVLVLGVKLKDGQLTSKVRVCPITWTVLGLEQPLCGDTEVWEFGGWKMWKQSIPYPEYVTQQAIAGGNHVYVAKSCSVVAASSHGDFTCPATPMVPADTRFLPGISSDVPVWRAASGHLLVKPKINGREHGYMVLDTGASTLVITPEAAEGLGLGSFGELYAASIAGKVPARFVKAKTWSLGPLEIQSPVMMTMPLGGLVRGGPPGGQIMGIVGYDIFRRAVLELPAMAHHSHATASEHYRPQEHMSVMPSDSTSISEFTLYPPMSSASPNSGMNDTVYQQDRCPWVDHAAIIDAGFDPDVVNFSSFGASTSSDDSMELYHQGLPVSQKSRRSQSSEGDTSSVDQSDNPSQQSGQGTMGFLRNLFGQKDQQLDSQEGRPQTATESQRNAGSDANHRDLSPFANQGSTSPGNAATSGRRKEAVTVGGRQVVNSARRITGNQGIGKERKDPKNAGNGCHEYSMRIHNPQEYGCMAEDVGWSWQDVKMISNLPHVQILLIGEGQKDRGTLPVLLMIDSGACGADIMFHARAMKSMDLPTRPTSSYVRGVGGPSADNNVRVDMVDLEWVEMAGVRFKKVKVMHAGAGGIDISMYSAGIICGDLLTRLPMVYDYARKRIGLRLE